MTASDWIQAYTNDMSKTWCGVFLGLWDPASKWMAWGFTISIL